MTDNTEIDEAKSSEIYQKYSSEIIRMYWSGMIIADIAREVNVSEWSVRKVLQLAGGKVARHIGGEARWHTLKDDAERFERISRLVDEGLSQGEILKAETVSRGALLKYFPEVKGRPRYKKPKVKKERAKYVIDPEILERVALMVADETPVEEISRSVGLSSPTIKKYFPNAGLDAKSASEVRWMFKKADKIYEEWGL